MLQVRLITGAKPALLLSVYGPARGGGKALWLPVAVANRKGRPALTQNNAAWLTPAACANYLSVEPFTPVLATLLSGGYPAAVAAARALGARVRPPTTFKRLTAVNKRLFNSQYPSLAATGGGLAAPAEVAAATARLAAWRARG